MRTRASATKMARLVAQWRASDDTQANFARRHGIPPWTFWYWCRKLTPSVAPAADAFVPVRIAEADAAPPVLEIVLSGGARVHVHAGASAALVQSAIAALRARC